MRFVGFLASLFFVVSMSFADDGPIRQVQSQANQQEIAIANERIATAVDASSIESPGRVVVVYFTPSDRKPAADHVERIRRISEETAGFYERELQRHGFANRSMNVLRDEQGRVDLIDVVGAEKDKDYGKPDGSKIRDEVVPVLKKRGIDPEASVILLFCNLMDYDPQQSKISHHSPYYGGGSHLSGTAWQCDSEILDPQRFTDTTPLLDGEYGRITIGRHNSIFIGGVIHELGHALSLPHCRERKDEAVRGSALMGSGNRTYGEQLRGEGPGTFLTQTHALRLAAHPVFNRQVAASINERPETDWSDLNAKLVENTVVIQGMVQSTVPVHSVVTYFDPAGGSDYDATTASSVPDSSGRFSLRSEAFKPSISAELRLVACHINGTTSNRTMRYRVDETGRPDLAAIRLEWELTPMLDALRSSDFQAAQDALILLSTGDETLQSIGQRVLDRFDRSATPVSLDPHEVPVETTSIPLSRLKPASASVGWMNPAYDRIPGDEKLLSIDGDYFASGIYAHAPAEHTYQLAKKWKRLTGRCGVQGTNLGTVDFEILAGNRSLWKSSGVTSGEGKDFDVDVRGIEILTLIVTDGGNGKNGDWGVWIEPKLLR